MITTVALCVGVAATAVVLWGQGGPLPDPLVTEADLPLLPDPSQNGWTAIQALPPDLAVVVHEDVRSALFTVQSEDSSIGARWEALTEASPAFHLPATPTQARALDAWAKAVRAPVMAPGCRRDGDEVCAVVLYGRIHQLALAESARLAVDGQWDVAKEKLASTLKADRELLVHSRYEIDAMVAVVALNEALPLVHLIEHRNRRPSARLRAECDALAEYGVLEDGGLKQRVATQNYVSSYNSLLAIEKHGVWAWTRDGDWRPSLLYDAEHTSSLLEAAYLKLGFDTEPDQGSGCDWLARLRNPIGCDYFDPQPSDTQHSDAWTSLEFDLQTAQRWSRRIQDLESPQ